MRVMQRYEWRDLLAKEAEARLHVWQTYKDGQVDADQLRAWWQLGHEILDLMATGQNTLPLPRELLFALSNFASYLARGTVPGPIADAQTRGRPKVGPEEERDIRWAVTYRWAVAEGIIADSSPVKKLKDAYGLRSNRTVQEWYADYLPFECSVHFNHGETIERAMLKAAEKYKAGTTRTQAAVLQKARERK